MSAQATIPRQAWSRIFGKKQGVPAQYRTSLVRAGAFTILGLLGVTVIVSKQVELPSLRGETPMPRIASSGA